MIVMKPLAIKYLWENSTELLDQLFSYFSYLPTEFEMVQEN